jgi:hypothetical protein
MCVGGATGVGGCGRGRGREGGRAGGRAGDPSAGGPVAPPCIRRVAYVRLECSDNVHKGDEGASVYYPRDPKLMRTRQYRYGSLPPVLSLPAFISPR